MIMSPRRCEGRPAVYFSTSCLVTCINVTPLHPHSFSHIVSVLAVATKGDVLASAIRCMPLVMQAWLTPSKAAGLLPPLAEQQDTVSRRVSSEQLQSPSECCDSSQKTPSPSTPHQEHEATHVQHLQYSSGVASQEEEHSETALNGNSGFEEQRSGISISSSPSSPLIANSISHRPGSTVSQAELYPSPLEAIGLSSNADHSQWKSHSLQTGDAAPWPMNKPAHASGSSSGISSGSEDAETLGLDPYTARHLCLQELELLWSEECSDVSNPYTSCHIL